MSQLTNLTDEIQRYKELKDSQSLIEQFETLKGLILRAYEMEDIETLHQLVSQELVLFSTSSFSYELLELLDQVDSLYFSKGHRYLTFLYAIRGHVFHFEGSFDLANDYYKSSISYATEYKEYRQLSICINNILTARFRVMPDELGFSLSKVVPLLIKQSKGYVKADYYSKFFIHLEYGLLLEKVDYVENILKHMEHQQAFEINSRNYLQLKIFQGFVAKKKKDYEKVIEINQFVIKICVETKLNKDLLRLAYSEILHVNDLTFVQTENGAIQHQYEQLIEDELQKNNLLQKYVNRQNDESFSGGIGIKKSEFQKQAEQLFDQTDEIGHTLVLIDVLLKGTDSEQLETVLMFIEQKVAHHFANYDYQLTLFDQTSIAFFVKERELQVDEICDRMFEDIRKTYPKEQSIVNAMYFAAVNNQENNTMSYRESLEMAKAYIYYELYK